MRLIHLSDLHLDAPFSNVSADKAAHLRAEQRELLGKYVDYADAHDIPLIVIAGDLFDGEYVTRDSADALCEIFGGTRARVIIAPGNHDPLNESSPYACLRFPDNVSVFDSPHVTHFDLPGLRVYGYAFTEAHVQTSPLAGFRAHPCGVPSILVAHADLDAPLSPYAPVSSETLGKCGVDYAALGHIHKASGLRHAGSTAYAYCGCLAGRGFDETGRKGALICDVTKDGVKAEPLYLTPRRYEVCRITLSGAMKYGEIVSLLHKITASFDENTHVRLYLDGETITDFDPKKYLPPLASLAVIDNTLPFDAKALEADSGVKGAFYRRIKGELLSENEETRTVARKALLFGLSVLDGRDIKL